MFLLPIPFSSTAKVRFCFVTNTVFLCCQRECVCSCHRLLKGMFLYQMRYPLLPKETCILVPVLFFSAAKGSSYLMINDVFTSAAWRSSYLLTNNVIPSCLNVTNAITLVCWRGSYPVTNAVKWVRTLLQKLLKETVLQIPHWLLKESLYFVI